MQTIAHISDLHFGTEDPRMVSALRASLLRLAPALLVVSGDLTQRARPRQFQHAAAFLQSLPFPQVVVPGNHDVAAWYRPWARLANGLGAYRRYISADMSPVFQNEEVHVTGINSARSLAGKGGRINLDQVERACAALGARDPNVVRIVVTHHPFDLPPGHKPSDLIGRAHPAMERFARCRVDVFLAGHLHRTYTAHTALRYRIAGHSALAIQAGTAISHRVRGELNSWNLLRITAPDLAIERWQWQDTQRTFVPEKAETYRRAADGWHRKETSHD